MRRSLLAGLVVLGACSGAKLGHAPRPDAVTKVERAVVLGPVLLGHSVDGDEATAERLGCQLDADPQERMFYFAQMQDDVNLFVIGELVACSRSEYPLIAGELAKAGNLQADAVQQVVTQGVDALDDAGL